MGRNAKVGIAGAVVLILAVVSMMLVETPLIPIAIVIIGGAGLFLLLRQDDDEFDDDDDDERPKPKGPKAKKGKARLDEILDDQAKASGTSTTKRAPTRPTPAPGGGLPTWSPGSVDAGATADDLAPSDLAGGSEANWDSWEKEWPAGDGDSLVLDDDDPLSSLDRLDDIDPVAEVERLDAAADDDPFAALRSDITVDDTFELDELDELEELDDEPAPAPAGDSAFSFSAAPPVINEEVSTADDIMAASTATELHVEDAGDSELARLLAKVQARLSAYE